MNGEMTAHERVQIARHPQRPGVRDDIDALFPHFFELRGDRLCGEDEAILGGVALYHGQPVPVIAGITGEGNSGGALALGVADHVLMLENAVYAILSPEGFASILYKDASRAGEAAEVMKLTAPELEALGVIDGIIPEPQDGAHTDPASVMQAVDEAIDAQLRELMKLQGKALCEQRYQKFRRMSAFELAELVRQPAARQER